MTVSKYIKVLLDAKIINECNRYDMKSKKAIRRKEILFSGFEFLLFFKC